MPQFAIANKHPLSHPAAIVRAAALHEFPAIADLLMRANREYRKLVPAATYDAYVHSLRTLTQGWADKEFLVAESNGKLVGTVAFYRDASAIGFNLPPEWAGLRALAVDPEARSRGIGRQLTEACVLRAWRLGRAAIVLHNAALQKMARRLYLSMGFERCPQHDIDGGDLVDIAGERLTVEAFCLDLRR